MSAVGIDSNLSTKVEFTISCKNLPSKDVLSKSDPFVVVWLQKNGSKDFYEIGRTETIQNNEFPDFDKKIEMEYFFEEEQIVKFSVYDSDGKTDDLSKHDFIGDLHIPLGEVMGASRGMCKRGLKNLKGKMIGDASIIIRADEIKGNNDILTIKFAGKNLDKKDLFGKSDPFYELYRLYKDGTKKKIFTSEVIKKDLNPQWQPLKIALAELCAGDRKKKFLVKVYDWDAVGDSDIIGECELCVADFEKKQTFAIDLMSPKKKKAGEFLIVSQRIDHESSFLDYIVGGCEMKLCVAVDFTGSNGNPKEPGTLHYHEGTTMNPYQSALSKVGSIVTPYANDGIATLWGFGAKLPNGPVSHCFPLTLDNSKLQVKGVDSILDAYKYAIQRVGLNGPTNFSEVIQSATAISASPFNQEIQHFTILLIITDGEISDMDRTISSIIDATEFPIAIIIVGVGEANFSSMQTLDGDNQKLSIHHKVSKRDIVQFVAFRDCDSSPQRLAKEVLAEIPSQFLSYMKAYNIKPNEPVYKASLQ